MPDLLLKNARLVATVDAERRELAGGWVSVTGGRIEAVGSSLDPLPVVGAETQVVDVADCLVTPGLVNTHHHIYQNLTRAFPPMTNAPLFGWLQTLYPLWRALDEARGLLERALENAIVCCCRVHARCPLNMASRCLITSTDRARSFEASGATGAAGPISSSQRC